MRKLVLTLALVSFGCASHKDEQKKDPPPTTPPPPVAAPETNDNQNAKDTSDNDCTAGVRVHFALNSSEMDSSEKDSLEKAARCLKADHAMHVTVEGNADERGTEEYNLALGDRRATTIAKYLKSLGVSPGQMKTVSYGKDQPLCVEHDEDCWAKNRRADVKTAEAATPKKKKR